MPKRPRLSHLLPALALLCLPLPACATTHAAQAEVAPAQQEAAAPAAPAPQAAQPALPIHMDKDLAQEHERFSQFVRTQVTRMNATIIGGRNSMHIYRGSDGLYHATYKAIDPNVVCQVRRSESDPSFYVGSFVYKEQVLESVAHTAEACRNGEFEPVSEKSSRVIYTSKRGGGWN